MIRTLFLLSAILTEASPAPVSVAAGKRQLAAFEHDCVAVACRSIARVYRDLHCFVRVDGGSAAEQRGS
jgi:hypothetical protein